jgi:hypothetical protein
VARLVLRREIEVRAPVEEPRLVPACDDGLGALYPAIQAALAG